MTERYLRKDFGHIEIEVTYTDPSIYSKPWTIKLDMQYAPEYQLIEFVCSETQIYGAHLVGTLSEEKNAEVSVDPKILAKYVGNYKELDVWKASRSCISDPSRSPRPTGNYSRPWLESPNTSLRPSRKIHSPVSAPGASGSSSTKKET